MEDMALAERIRRWREEHDVTQSALGAILGRSKRTVRSWEQGEPVAAAVRAQLLDVLASPAPADVRRRSRSERPSRRGSTSGRDTAPPPSREAIVVWRRRHEVTRRGFAALVGVTESAVLDWELGRKRIARERSAFLHQLLAGVPPVGTERGQDPVPVRGDVLKAWRTRFGVSCLQVARLVGTCRSAVSAWEAGKAQPVPAVVRKLDALLRGPPPGWTPPPPPEPPAPPIPPIDPVALRTWRVEHGMTLQQLATLVGVSEAAISRWERGLIGGRPESRRRLHEVLVGSARDHRRTRTAIPPPRRLVLAPSSDNSAVLQAIARIVGAYVDVRPEADLVELVKVVRGALEG